jgi:hypothetical protein
VDQTGQLTFLHELSSAINLNLLTKLLCDTYRTDPILALIPYTNCPAFKTISHQPPVSTVYDIQPLRNFTLLTADIFCHVQKIFSLFHACHFLFHIAASHIPSNLQYTQYI